MRTSVYIGSTKVPLKAKDILGTGGEADVYRIGDKALKVYKAPDHPDLQAPDPKERKLLVAAAVERVDTAQKKLRQFPKGLPSSVLTPIELAFDAPPTTKATARIVGYTMPFIPDAQLLYYYSKRKFREQGHIANDTMTVILASLHEAVEQLHQHRVIIGDFNDLNVLVKDKTVYLIDADSFQFGSYLCRTFQYRFVDPLICSPTMELTKVHTENTDWYAFACMVIQSLLYIEPYGGVYKPKGHDPKVTDALRPIHRISIFHPSVQYPKNAIPWNTLSDDLVDYLKSVFEKDKRELFPINLVSSLTWRVCNDCGLTHARRVCPGCGYQIIVKPIYKVVTGTIAVVSDVTVTGRIMGATVQNGKLLWLNQENDVLYRGDNSSTVMNGRLLTNMKVRMLNNTTYVAKGSRLVEIVSGRVTNQMVVDEVDGVPAYDTNSKHIYWVEGGVLWRDKATTPTGYNGVSGVIPFQIGQVLSHQTNFWVGETFGFGYYRAGALSSGIVFDAEQPGINDRVDVPFPNGQILDSNCVFSDNHCWLFLSAQSSGHINNYCFTYSRQGKLLASAQAVAGDGSWLSTTRGKLAFGVGKLLAATDNGLVALEIAGSDIVETRSYPDSEPYVSFGSHLFAGKDGLYVIEGQNIRLLKVVGP